MELPPPEAAYAELSSLEAAYKDLTRFTIRLEAATSRLEEIAQSTQSPSSRRKSVIVKDVPSIAPPVNGKAQFPPSRPVTGDEVPSSLQAYDALLAEEMKNFEDKGSMLGGVVAEQTSAFARAFAVARKVLQIAPETRRPDASFCNNVLKNEVEVVYRLKSDNRNTIIANHLTMLADDVAILDWMMQTEDPSGYVNRTWRDAKYWGDRIRREFKVKDPSQVEWVEACEKFCTSLESYIKQHYPRGIVWNERGMSSEQAIEQLKTDPDQANASPETALSNNQVHPPPPPPPPPPPYSSLDVPSSPAHPGASAAPISSSGDMGAVFDQLNRGGSVTAGLRKVDKSEMTHKNPSLRAQVPVIATSDDRPSSNDFSAQSSSKTSNRGSTFPKRPGRKELEGTRWIVENFENRSDLIELDAEKRQSVLISQCHGVKIAVHGKANAVSVDHCVEVGIALDSLVSSIEVINTKNFRMQYRDTLPSIQMDKVDGATIYLSKPTGDEIYPEIYTSKCTNVNIVLPPKSEDQDGAECPVPEQVKTSVLNGQLVSEIVRIEG